MVSRTSSADAIDAQAAAWVTRLQGDTRSAGTEDALRRWLDADPAHQDAFERATDIWTIIPGAMLHGATAEAASPSRARGRIGGARAKALAVAAALLLMIGGGGWVWWLEAPTVYSTEPGEQRIATLEDGSRIALNTGSEVDVRYDADRRAVRLEHGEAMFEVAHDADRPFVVTAGDKRVRAVGTIFIVRREGADVTVTLIEGKVAVTDTSRADGPRTPPPTYLTPGDRLTASATGAASVDHQSIEAATAWRRGQAVFDDTPLAAAVAELNRYGGPHIVIDDPRLAFLPVSGVFATNDAEEFARAAAALHHLHVAARDETLHIIR
jgi:transmembrane sensor